MLVTGAAGFLGSNVVWFAQEKYEVIATSLNPVKVEGYEIEKMDISDREACFDIIEDNKPDLVIHCGAVVDPIVCEEKREFANKVNVQGTKNLADACLKVGARIVLTSSDWVFDGKKRFGKRYSESDEAIPVNHYGITKLKAENELKKSGAKWISARPANIYGNSYAVPKDESLKEEYTKRRGGWTIKIINALKDGEKISMPIDWFQTPTLASNFAKLVLKLHEKDQQGIFHIAEKNCVSRSAFVREIAKAFDLDEGLITAVNTYSFAKSIGIDMDKSTMQIPLCTCLDVSKIEGTLKIKMTSLREGLEEMKKQRETYDLFKA